MVVPLQPFALGTQLAVGKACNERMSAVRLQASVLLKYTRHSIFAKYQDYVYEEARLEMPAKSTGAALLGVYWGRRKCS